MRTTSCLVGVAAVGTAVGTAVGNGVGGPIAGALLLSRES